MVFRDGGNIRDGVRPRRNVSRGNFGIVWGGESDQPKDGVSRLGEYKGRRATAAERVKKVEFWHRLGR